MNVYNKLLSALSSLLLPICLCCTFTVSAQLSIDKPLTQRKMQQVADWQIANFVPGKGHDRGLDAWTNATLYLGMYNWASIDANQAGQSKYFDWLYNIGKQHQWQLATQYMYHADALCVGQTYVKMFRKYNDLQIIKPTQERVDWIMNHPPSPETKYRSWTWSDALFMAPPLYAELSKLTGDSKYVDYMDREFKITYHLLYDKSEHLFYRDKSYFDKKEANGAKVFWGRGNAWVLAGLVNILKALPADSPYRSFYIDLFKEMTARIVSLQNTDGFWHASLLDPASYPSPESSATGLISYALAYGINQHLLTGTVYTNALNKAWAGLLAAVNKDGKLTWVQPIGADPKKVTEEMTDVFGVGAFLLAGSEMLQ